MNTSVKTFKSFNEDFNLMHEDGFDIKGEQLIDQPSLIYFGYTYCPDICPFDLMKFTSSRIIEK